MIKKKSAYKNKPSTAKVDECILCGCSMSMRWAFEDTGNKYDRLHEKVLWIFNIASS